MNRITSLASVIGISLGLGGVALADDLQFETLPQPVQTTVIREGRIPDARSVMRVIRDGSGVYAVTLHRDFGNEIVYVNDYGEVVRAPQTTTYQTVQPETTLRTVEPTTTVQTVQPQVTTEQTVTTYDQIRARGSRYELVEKKGNKEIYIDHQTGEKVKVKREQDDRD